MSKFTEKLKKVGTKSKTLVKTKPKLAGSLLALVIVLTGGNATGLLATTDVIDAAVKVIQAME